MSMLTAVSADVMNRLSPDAGIVLCDIDDIETVADAEAMVEIIEQMRGDPEHWIGVTDGGIKVTEGRTWWSPAFDGKRMPWKGDKFLDTAEPKMSFTLLEMTPENVSRASAAADIKKDSETKTTVTPRATIKAGDYRKNLVFVTMVGPDGLYIAVQDNALCTKGVDASTADKNVAKLAVEFVAHQENPNDYDLLPQRYYFLKKSAA